MNTTALCKARRHCVMPVRSLSSHVVRWPDRDTVHQSLLQWAESLAEEQSSIKRIGYFGSYARGDWGPGSDLDIAIVVSQADKPLERRSAAYDATRLPVPADVLVYTEDEWQVVLKRGRFGGVLAEETVWVYRRSVSGADRIGQ